MNGTIDRRRRGRVFAPRKVHSRLSLRERMIATTSVGREKTFRGAKGDYGGSFRGAKGDYERDHRARSADQSIDDLSVHIREAEIAAGVVEGELFVVEAEKLEDGRLKIVDVHGVLRDVETQVVGCPVR
jgi:hypothetical protein